jgi:hypothetical protein
MLATHGSTDTSFISWPHMPQGIALGGTAKDTNSEVGMAHSLELQGAAVAFLGAGRELISRGL